MVKWLIGVAAATAVLGPGQTAAAQDLPLDRVVAVINQEVVLESELDRRMVQQTTTQNAADPRRAMLWAMIDERLLVQRGLAAHLDADDAEIERALDEVRKQNGLTKQKLLEELSRVGYTLDEYRVSIYRQLVSHKLLTIEVRANVVVSDADIKALYDKRVKAAEGQDTAKLEDVKEALRQEIYAERMDLARDRLLVDLRAGAFIDIRLPAAARPTAEEGAEK